MKGLSSVKAEIASAVLESLGVIKFRSQFGGFGIWHGTNMFGVIADGELYLRANGELRQKFARRGMSPLIYTKRGIPVRLGYYRIEDEIWNDYALFRKLARASMRQSVLEKTTQAREDLRLHALPNISVSMARWLHRIGITSAEQLIQTGAEQAFLLLKNYRKELPDQVLYDLAGAISGCHRAVLPESVRTALGLWLREQMKKKAAQKKTPKT